jgi:hypothetical protein
MLNPLGILAFASQPSQKLSQNKQISDLIARHKFEASRPVARAMNQNTAKQQEPAIESGRAPASAGSIDYSCLKHLKQ